MNSNSLAIDFAPDADGWCRQVVRDPSPNFDRRPDAVDISLLVIHNISLPAGRFGGPHIADLFCNRLNFDADPSFEDLRGVRVSAHFLIGRDGAVTQFVPVGARAWHAGRSSFAGRSNCNDFSIGIEVEGSDATPFADCQYQVLSSLTAALQAAYPLTDVTGHMHIAPDRKSDPGPFFDWTRYRLLLDRSAKSMRTQPTLGFPALS